MHLMVGPAPRLADWDLRAFNAGAPPEPCFRDHHARVVAVEAPGPPEPGGAFERAAAAIAVYDVFPPWIGQGVIRRPVQLGDTVGLLCRLVPGVVLFFASRVIEVLDGPGHRSGFTYRTLRGHVESGEETFAVEKDPATGAVTVSLSAWSVPAHPLVRLALPVARHLQLRAGRAALDHLQSRVQEPFRPAR